jgi:hypothetical protein
VIASSVTKLGEFSPIGRLFSLGIFFENYKRANILVYFFRGLNFELILAQNGLGYILGEFFTNSSGHPDCQ